MRKTTVVLALVCLTIAGAANASPSAELEARIAAKLVESFGNDAKAIRVAVADGKAVLIGRVAERSTQELAEQVALYFPEIKSVDNQLKADKDKNVFEGQLRDEGEDAKLEHDVRNALESEIGTHVKQIEVEAADGVVVIRGTVPDESRQKFARDAAAKVKGVRKLVELLRVKK